MRRRRLSLLQLLLLLCVSLHHLLRLLLVFLFDLRLRLLVCVLFGQLLMLFVLLRLQLLSFLVLLRHQLVLLLLVFLVCLRVAGVRSSGALGRRQFVGMDGIWLAGAGFGSRTVGSTMWFFFVGTFLSWHSGLKIAWPPRCRYRGFAVIYGRT